MIKQVEMISILTSLSATIHSIGNKEAATKAMPSSLSHYSIFHKFPFLAAATRIGNAKREDVQYGFPGQRDRPTRRHNVC